ncbi:MAG TPA: 2-hydroxyacyl-CoA dehydratase family protein [Syntrophales bacterium]|nr:2-hydroxyacyl-CoA dehydratase family protein [Syntrophales bacterium]HON22671.1 2-hydroxyacyl-CoA dehydratase family protein [Syntrophales bacterium]HPC33536.1 2-hydroxyacyl-CoA dehydratase family protein [Syntrophales bacterium]HQJ30975.1 2-hydroxyacyl-CoA dehydratase family protein [Syntrophales bacterium]HRR48105.1 2-hydroxyacyl-CoA dehydratase family protein [Syntrophales bacterium]
MRRLHGRITEEGGRSSISSGRKRCCRRFCRPYLVESGPVEKQWEAVGLPNLRLETDYSQEDAGQLKTRIEAFLERLQRK